MNKKPGGNLRSNFAAMGWAVKKFFGFYPVLAPLAMFCILFSALVAAIPNFFIVQNVLHAAERWMVSGDWAFAMNSVSASAYAFMFSRSSFAFAGWSITLDAISTFLDTLFLTSGRERGRIP